MKKVISATHQPSFFSKTIWIILLVLGLVLSFPHSTQAASLTVNSTADTTTASDGQCTLREAIANANSDSDTTGGDCVTGSGTDTISFDPSVLEQTILLLNGELVLSSSMTIEASSPGVTLDGNNSSRIFVVNAGQVVTLTNLRITNGRNTSSTNGGGIQNSGTLTINNSMIDHNTISKVNALGGGIVNGTTGSLTINNSTLWANTVSSTSGTGQAGGGAISNSGTMVLNNTTLSGNTVTTSSSVDNGGALRNTGTVTLYNVTVVANSSADNGGGIQNGGVFTLHNTVIANNTSTNGPDCRGTLALNYSLLNNTAGCTVVNNGGNLLGVNPLLMPLDANGGGSVYLPALTAYPNDGSPILDAGNNATCLSTDQRGNPRPVGTCDMGAIEKQTGEETDRHCSWTVGVPHTFGTDVNLAVTPNSISNTSACISVLKRPVFPGFNQSNGEFPIVWTVVADTGTTFDLDVDFCYSEAELTSSGVTDENTIVAFHLQNGVWQGHTTTPDPANNCVGTSGVTSLSPWTVVGNGNAPTAIQLQNLTARTAASPLGFALMLVALLGLVAGFFLIRSRR
ncbi:MAG: CSLREA domain-containing protein [Anaerolineales bacterium]|nr:CSLREA domain-containing protein [Anaerolineales bacterium]